jgi:FAD/FMN-containing dehydrogenase
VSGEFVNWSGSLRFTPAERATAASEEDVVRAVESAAERGLTIRPVGAGHSSTPLMATDDVLLSLDAMSGLVGHDGKERRATVLPGTGLADAGDSLGEVGLAMENLGDVDYQAIAGAMGTGTHGTGLTLGNLSTMLVGGRMVTGRGEVVSFDESDPDLLRAARVSLGALGIFTSMTLQLVPAFDLHRITWCTHIDWVLDHLDELVLSNRRFDFYWYPRSDMAQVRILNEPGHEARPIPPGSVHSDERGPGHEIIPQSRHLKFDEMEYMVALEDGPACFREVRKRVKDRHRATVGWRVLVRTVAADDSMISNCYQRPTMTIALLQNAELPHDRYFEDMEPLLVDFGGRPHWGKKHSQRAADLRPLFSEWDRFQEIRHGLDPQGVLMNDHLSELFEEPDE